MLFAGIHTMQYVKLVVVRMLLGFILVCIFIA